MILLPLATITIIYSACYYLDVFSSEITLASHFHLLLNFKVKSFFFFADQIWFTLFVKIDVSNKGIK